MNIESVEDFLGNDLDTNVLKILNEWKPFMDKIFHFGGEIFCEILNKPILGKDDSLPIIMLFRNSIELFESISVLQLNFYSEPAKIILRTLLETSLNIEYIVEKDSVNRALSFLICHSYEKLTAYKKVYPNSSLNKELTKKLVKDEFLKEIKVNDINLLNKQIENSEQLINLELYEEVNKEYMKVKKKKGRRPIWTELFNGPRNLEELAYHLRKGSLYEILYRNLSKDTHGKSIIDGNISAGNEKGKTNFNQIRFPYSAQSNCQFSITIMLNIFRQVIKNQIPHYQEKYNEFYKNEIKDFYLIISTKPLLIIE